MPESMVSKQPLTAIDFAMLARSYISADLAREAALFRVDSLEGGRLVGRNGSRNYAGIVFPYHWPGEPSPSCFRLRRDTPELEEKSDGTVKEKGKYLCAPGDSNRLYFAPSVRVEWLSDVAIPVAITEGEKKTLALSGLAVHDWSNEWPRFVPIGISGVWNWRGVRGKADDEFGIRRDVRGVIPDLERITWQDRAVFIVFDANTRTNQSVAAARRALAKDLTGRGAKVLFVDLPQLENVNGVDDLLAEKGPEFVLKLINDAKPARAKLPPSFRLSEIGVYYSDPTGDGDDMFICSPLTVAAATRSTDGEDWGRLLEFTDADGRPHEWAMPMSMLAGEGAEYRARLLSMGLVISSRRKARELLTTYIQSSMPDKRVWCVAKVGWHGESYVLPDQVFGGRERVLFQSSGFIEHRFRVAGTIEEWQEEVARYCIGNSRLVFAVSAAFAGPVLGLTGEGGGGFHFRGKSSIGKSTLLIVAGSVWGGHSSKGYIETWRATANGLETVAELHNHGLLCLDEISECDPRTVGPTAYMLANGIGKSRMSRGGHARRRQEWNLLFLSSGEQSLSDVVIQSGQHVKAGQEIRMCDLEADAGKGMGIFEELNGMVSSDELARHLSQSARKHYGHPIRRYLADILCQFPNLNDALDKFRSRFFEQHLPADASGEITRAAQRFALIGAAGELAGKVTRWTEGTSFEAAGKLFEVWKDNRKTFGHQDDENAIQQIRSFLESHGSSRFQDVNDIATHIYNRAGFKRTDGDGETEYLILSEVFKQEVCKGYDTRSVIRLLADRGVLTPGDGRNLAKRETLPELGRTRVYVVSRRILDL